jgi:Na+/melibiose symporter-like transporter
LTVRLHTWFEKHETIIGAMALTAFAAAGPVLLRVCGIFPPNGSPALMPLLLLFHALFYTGVAILVISVLSALADVADEHELITGLRQEGVFFASRTLFAKLTAGLGTIFAGIAVDVIHFPQGAKPGEVAQEVLFKLGLVNGPISSLPLLFSVFFYLRYRIDKRRHAEIQQALIARRKTNAPTPASDQPVAGGAPQPAVS